MKVEICENCGAEIGKLERAFIQEGHIICSKCSERMRAEAKQLSALTISKPGKVTAIGGMRLGAGVCNILAGLVCYWFVLPLLLIPLGIVEIISASNLLKAEPDYPSGLKTIAILEIVAIVTLAGWISLAVGILTLVFLGDPRVKKYLDLLSTENRQEVSSTIQDDTSSFEHN
jgi:hypothetical protein